MFAPGCFLLFHQENSSSKLRRSSTTFGLKMNTQKGYTKDVNIRKAICYAFDYPATIKVYNGNAILEDSPFPKGMKGYIPCPNVYRQDVKKAKEYLAKAGYPNGGFELDRLFGVVAG